MSEGSRRQVYYQYLGTPDAPICVPQREYDTWSYNLWVAGGRPAATCYSAVVFYKRGYLTTLWTPGRDTRVPMLSLADSRMNDKATGEGEIDWLLQWHCLRNPDRARYYGTGEKQVLRGTVWLSRHVQRENEFRRIVEFSIKEYQELQSSLGQQAPRSLAEKARVLSEFLERN